MYGRTWVVIMRCHLAMNADAQTLGSSHLESVLSGV
jgi:hypothetical protein